MNFVEMGFLYFCEAVGVKLYPWQAESFGAACKRVGGRFIYRLAAISVPRGNGKSLAAAAVGLWRLVCGGKHQHIISAALDSEGAQVVLDHARHIVQSCPALSELLEIRANEILCKKAYSRWTVTSREHTASRGRHPTLIIYDEVGWVRDDELFSSLTAGQAPVEDPLALVVSTVGRRQSGPLWNIKQLAEGGDAATYWYHSSENQSPRVTRQFLDQQRRILLPGQFAREHQNSWVDAADSFTSQQEVDDAMGGGRVEEFGGRTDVAAEIAVDIGIVHDPSVVAVGYLEAGKVVVGRLLTFKGNKSRPVQISSVAHAVQLLCTQWSVSRIRIESWQGIEMAQGLKQLGYPAEIYTATQKAHSEEWPLLAQRLSGGGLDLFPHAQLREELLNLVYLVGPSGAKVIDRGQVHQDHATTVRMLCAQLASRRSLGVPSFDGAYMSGPANRDDEKDHEGAVADPLGQISEQQRSERRRGGAFYPPSGTSEPSPHGGTISISPEGERLWSSGPQQSEDDVVGPQLSRSGRVLPVLWRG